MARTLLAALAGVSLLAGGGCSDGGASAMAAIDATAIPPDLAMPDLKFAGYPPGPYGGDVGSTVQNFILQGYLRPNGTTGLASDVAFGELSFDDLRRSGKRYALIEMAGFW